MPIPRQLAPTVGHKVPGVTFQAGTLGGVGKQIAVGRVTRYDGHSYVNSDESWLPADDYLIGCAIIPIGGIDVFIGYTPEAYGLPRFYNPTHQPFDRQDGSESAFSQESAESDFHFVGVVGLGSTPSRKTTILSQSSLLSRRMRCQMPDPDLPFKST